MIKILSLKTLRDGRVNPTFKLSPEAGFLMNDVINGDEIPENDLESVLGSVIGARRSQELFLNLKKNDEPKKAWLVFWEGLGFGTGNLSQTETNRIKTLLKKFLNPRVRLLESEKTELINQIERLQSQMNA